LGVNLGRGKSAIAIFIQGLEGFGCACEFIGGDGSIAIEIESLDHGRNRALLGRFGTVFGRGAIIVVGLLAGFSFFGRRHEGFLKADFPIVISVQFTESPGRSGDFLGGQFSIMVLIKNSEQRWDGWWWWRTPISLGWAGHGGEADGEGDE